MAVLKINFVILLVIVILSHMGFSPDKEDVADTDRGASKRKHVEVGESSVKRRNLEVDQSDSIEENPVVVSEEIENIYKDQKLCLEKIRDVFGGKTYEDHIKHAMKELIYADKYYRSLEDFLKSSNVMSVDMFCGVEGLGRECIAAYTSSYPNDTNLSETVGDVFGRSAIFAVKRIFGSYTTDIIREYNNPLLTKYFDSVISRYEIITKKSTSPEQFCQDFHKLPEGAPALDLTKEVVDTTLAL